MNKTEAMLRACIEIYKFDGSEVSRESRAYRIVVADNLQYLISPSVVNAVLDNRKAQDVDGLYGGGEI